LLGAVHLDDYFWFEAKLDLLPKLHADAMRLQKERYAGSYLELELPERYRLKSSKAEFATKILGQHTKQAMNEDMSHIIVSVSCPMNKFCTLQKLRRAKTVARSRSPEV
jgi:hypothetical protein